uniref:Mitochondrial transcription termination factor n=1 Tax=Glossina morsitans morsitans TaxID=37546 RepID=A0A1B0FKW8_GLOMM
MWARIISGSRSNLSLNYGKVVQSLLMRRAFTPAATPSNEGLSDLETNYIVPYRDSKDLRPSVKNVKKSLKNYLNLSSEEIEQILNKEGLRKIKGGYAISNIEILNKAGIQEKCFVDFPWIITLQTNRLKEKLSLLRSVNGLKDINDFVAYLRVPLSRLRKIIGLLNSEGKYLAYGNRVYYISEKLALDPYIVNKHLAKRLFVLELPCEMLEENLQLMLNYKVAPMNILKDLWVFLYAPSMVDVRLKRAALGKKDRIMPWMVKCPESTLKRSLQLTQDKLEVLGDKQTADEYVAERLKVTVEEARAIMMRYDQVNTVRVTKIKEVFDYLLDEAGYSTLEISQVPRILCNSLKTTKKRLEQLKQLGCRPPSLAVICRSKLQYEKWIEIWMKRNQIKET